MWSRLSHTFKLLTNLTPRKFKFKWIDIKHQEFGESEHILDRNKLVAYPDLNKKFDINTNAINFKLGAVTTQGGK